RQRGGEGGIVGGIGGQRRPRRFGKEQQAVEGHFGQRRLYPLGGVEDARRAAGAAKARTVRIGAVAKGRRQQVIEPGALRRHGRLARLQHVLEQRLLGEAVDQLQRR